MSATCVLRGSAATCQTMDYSLRVPELVPVCSECAGPQAGEP